MSDDARIERPFRYLTPSIVVAGLLLFVATWGLGVADSAALKRHAEMLGARYAGVPDLDGTIDSTRAAEAAGDAGQAPESLIADLERQLTRHRVAVAGLSGGLFLFIAIIEAGRTRRHVRDLERSKRQLKQSEERLSIIVDNTYDMVTESELTGKLVYANDRFLDARGFSRDEVLKRPAWDGVAPDDKERIRRRVAEALPTRSAVRETFRIGDSEGGWMWFEATVKPFQTPSGDIHLLNFGVDITSQRFERELRDNLLATLDASGDFIALSDKDFRLVYVNAAGRKLVGLDPEADVRSLSTEDFLPERLAGPLARQVMEGQARSGRWEGETFLTHFCTGKEIPVHIVCITLNDPDTGEIIGYANVSRDITLLREAERERQQQSETMARNERLASLGLLAGGVAHDFSNLSAGLQLNVEELRSLSIDRPESERRVRMIEDVARQMASLSNQLLTYAATERIETEVVDLAALVDEAVRLNSSSIPDGVRIYRGGASEVRACVNPVQVTQLISNLILNASQAIENGGGDIRIEAWHVEDASTHRAGTPLPAAPGALLTVSDTGRGIPNEDQGRIFDPFFSRREGGTGLGLAVVSGIVRAHAGVLTVDSAPDDGTTFTIFFPDTPQSSTTDEPKTLAPGTSPPRERGAVLLVEDEPSLRETVSRSLEVRGVEVVAVADGASAIEAIRSSHLDFALAVVDLRLPDTNGVALFESMSGHCPGLRGILCSADPQQVSAEAVSRAGFEAVLAKPYSLESLIDFVSKAVETSSAELRA